jgi:peptide/nickel transport system ATP-binding protein
MCSIRAFAAAVPRPAAVAELLAVRDLRVAFGTEHGPARVLDGISLDVAPGEVVGLVGESGCGKTTLARAILGVLPPGVAHIGGGTIRFQGRDLLAEPREIVNQEVRGRAITVIPQDPFTSFNPVFTVGAQLMEVLKWKSPRAPAPGRWPAVLRPYPRRRYGVDRAAALDMLRAVQIPDPERALGRLPHEFSGGQRQRLMIAMALLPNPALVIADEPTTALDVTIQAQILKLLRGLVKERGVSVLFTTHDLGTAYEICDRIVVMYAGQEMEAAPTAAFFERPAHPYTRRLLESLPTPGAEIRDIPGEVPNLVAPPAGCRFHPRCEAATAECRRERPRAQEAGVAHRVHCYHPVRRDARAGLAAAEP